MGRRTYIPQRGQAQPCSRTIYSGLDGVKRCGYTGEKTKCTGEELNYIVLMYMLYMTARNRGGNALRDRLRKVPGAWGFWRSGVGLLARGMDAIFCTMPQAQIDTVDAMSRHGHVDIHLPKAVGDDEGRMIVDQGAFVTIMEAAMEQCKICFLSGSETKRCALCHALESACPPKTWETKSGCVFRDVAMNSMGEMTERTKI